MVLCSLFLALVAPALWTLSSAPAPAVAQAPTWCGKYYEPGSQPVNPGGQFPTPAYSETPLLNFGCAPAIRPYLAPDDVEGSLVLDAGFDNYVGVHVWAPAGAEVPVQVYADGQLLTETRATIGLTGLEAPISLAQLTPRTTPYTLTCVASLPGAQTVTATNTLTYLPPNPYGGSTTKFDTRTGATLVRSFETGLYEPIFPLGFYTTFGGYLDSNLTILDHMKEIGYNMVHPVPTFDNLTAFNMVVDRMEQLGLWLMYDMRWTYTNDSSVTEQVNSLKNRTNLLVWYTGDEPDGTSDPLNATSLSRDLIYSLDGYHPVSLVLNCQDYYWTEYTSGADIIMEDPYPIGINATYSVTWNTSCTPELGDCGCDNCIGSYTDITSRVDMFAQRTVLTGRQRNLTTWHVPQGFGSSEYWSVTPTGQEWLVQCALAINHGARAIVPWVEPTTSDIENSAMMLSQSLPELTAYLFDPTAFTGPILTSPTVDTAYWSTTEGTLVMAVNMAYEPTVVSFPLFYAPFTTYAKPVLASGGNMTISEGKVFISLDSVGIAAYVLL
ncbi:hypothetical protein CALCODRAFT_435102 [Calocera cornea HHB12733]|uniref:Glycoside hydrolase family 2 protein n=1 Tax=Calocera cornea HHB12733 TaxID=1353952 RepID=A0A165FKG2_9BASI|nr:hypothetical protein CALCODRAFT_435102 [Calocera cornea HHB12733]